METNQKNLGVAGQKRGAKMGDLAQKAYHAYCESVGWKSPITGDELPHYDDLPQEIKAAWDAVVQRLARIIG